MAAGLGMSQPEFLRKLAHTVNGRWTLNEMWSPHGGYDCVFLRRDDTGKALCAIYETRPLQCRTWPYWPENLRTPQTWEKSAQRCPGMQAGQTGRGTFTPLTQIRILRDQMLASEEG